jgi:hypothetical protein
MLPPVTVEFADINGDGQGPIGISDDDHRIGGKVELADVLGSG